MGLSFKFLLFLLLGFKVSPIIFLLRVSLFLHFEFVFCNNSYSELHFSAFWVCTLQLLFLFAFLFERFTLFVTLQQFFVFTIHYFCSPLHICVCVCGAHLHLCFATTISLWSITFAFQNIALAQKIFHWSFIKVNFLHHLLFVFIMLIKEFQRTNDFMFVFFVM